MQKITLGHLGFGGIAHAVLASGEAVGTVYRSASVQDGAATFWDAQGQAFQLPGPLPSEARDLNEAWTVAGSSASGAMRWWPTEGRAEYLENTPSGGVGRAIDGQNRVWGNVINVMAVWEVGQRGYLLINERGVQAVVRGGNEVLAVGWAERPGSPSPSSPRTIVSRPPSHCCQPQDRSAPRHFAARWASTPPWSRLAGVIIGPCSGPTR